MYNFPRQNYLYNVRSDVDKIAYQYLANYEKKIQNIWQNRLWIAGVKISHSRMNWNVLRILSLSDKLSQEVVFLFLSIYQSWRICMVGRAIISFLFCKLSTFLNFLYLHHHQIISLKCSNKNLILFWSSIVEKRKERKYLKHSDLFGKSQNCANKESDSFWPILKS